MRQVFSPLARIVCVLIYSFVLVACENIDDILLFKNVGDPQLFQNDPDAEADANTADVELDNAELITLGVVQSTLLATQNTALYKFLDASDLPEGAIPTPADETKGAAYQYVCETDEDGLTGTITYTDSRKTSNENIASPDYQVGDTVSVKYFGELDSEGLDHGCMDINGNVYRGTLSATYTAIDGLNPTFQEIDAFSCANNLADDLDLASSVEFGLETFQTSVSDVLDNNFNNEGELTASASYSEDGVYFVVADELQFRAVGGDIEVDLVKYSYIPDPSALDELLREDTVLGTISYDRHSSAIFANMKSKLIVLEASDDHSLSVNHSLSFDHVVASLKGVDKVNQMIEEGVASLGVDRIYQIIEGVTEIAECQQYERTLSVFVTDFSTEKEGLTTTLNGSLELVSASENLHKRDATIKDSAFRTTVKQANLVEEFYMSDYTAATYFDENEEVYAYNFSGEVSSDAIFGSVTLAEGNDFIRYSAEEQPHSGAMVILGQGLERLQLTVESQFLQILVDHDGDSDGNALPDYDEDIETSWFDLLERDFVELN